MKMESNTSLNTSNDTSGEGVGLIRNEELARMEQVVQGAIFVLAVAGNAIVVIGLFCRRKKLSRMNLLILHLCLADFFVAFFNVLPQLLWDITFTFQGGPALCKLVTYLQLVAMYASSYVLVTTAIDRYLVICHPLLTHAWSACRIHSLVGVAWIMALAFSLPQMFIFSYIEISPGLRDCRATFNPDWTLQLYITWIAVSIYVLPSIFLVLTYGRICYAVWRSSVTPPSEGSKRLYLRCVNGNNSPSLTQPILKRNRKSRESKSMPARTRKMSRSKVKTVKLTLTVILCYLLCWSPFFISQLWAAWDVDAPFEGNAMVIIMLLASLNSCTNPWIYLAYSGALCDHLCPRSRQNKDGHRSARSGTMDSDVRPKFSCNMSTEEIRMDSLRRSARTTSHPEVSL